MPGGPKGFPQQSVSTGSYFSDLSDGLFHAADAIVEDEGPRPTQIDCPSRPNSVTPSESCKAWTPPLDPPCESCGNECFACPSLSQGMGYCATPMCFDPDCSLNYCDLCSDSGECCDGDSASCGLECALCTDCDMTGYATLDDPFFAGPFSELLGDQTTEIFGLDSCLPHLRTETASAVPSSFLLAAKDADAAAPTRPVPHRSSICLDAGYAGRPSPDPVPFWDARATTDHTRSPFLRLHQHPCSAEQLACSTSPASPTSPTVNSVSRNRSPASTLVDTEPKTSTDNEWSRCSTTCREIRAKKQPTAVSTRCQWADRFGQPCGKLCVMGDDLHEHLQTAHGVKTEAMCRWLGCQVSVSGARPHQYANGVQRHTWGHSGYRPYKCPACLEGFAAAKILEEHFTNFHLNQKPFECDTCSHQCTSAANLKRHKLDKHRPERFQCEFCHRNGKVKLFPRGPNLARHFRKCRYVLASFPDAKGAVTGKIDDRWFPPGYRGGNRGMDKARVIPPQYLSARDGT